MRPTGIRHSAVTLTHLPKKLLLKLTGRRAGGAKASTAGVAKARVSGAGAPAGLPDGRFHGTPKRTFAPRVKAAA